MDRLPSVASLAAKGQPRVNITGRIHAENQLLDHRLGFSGAFMAVQYLVLHIESFPDFLTRQTLSALMALGESDRFKAKKQALFLYRAVFDAMVKMALSPKINFSQSIIPRLQRLLMESKGRKNQALAEALTRLPSGIGAPKKTIGPLVPPVKIPFKDLVNQFPNPSDYSIDPQRGHWKGRSLVFRLSDQNMGVIKFANSHGNRSELALESLWMDHFTKIPPCPGIKFLVPKPIKINHCLIFEPCQIPGRIKNALPFKTPATAIAYTTHAQYFEYPNRADVLPGIQEIKEIFSRNAFILGTLTSLGIAHTALIPLFHNRIQQGRRRDGGRYLWEHGGRLDQWLHSCQYPNFGDSGIRDFEHLTPLKSSRDLAHFIGEHLLGFILVMGSYFRNKDASVLGKNEKGIPRDARHLFDPQLFADLILIVMGQYYHAVTGKPLAVKFPVKALVRELIPCMGIDNHMEERLRVADQQRMTDEEFHLFLNRRGVACETLCREREDITLETGPHLGGFNQPISAPALIELLFTYSALCISDAYLNQTGSVSDNQPVPRVDNLV